MQHVITFIREGLEKGSYILGFLSIEGATVSTSRDVTKL